MAGANDEDDDGAGGGSPGYQRLDKWLWFARIVKSRTLAASLVAAGKIRVNKAKAVKPSHWVKPGDVITSSVQREVRIFRVVAPGVRRGPATEAQTLYEELTVRRQTEAGLEDKQSQGIAARNGIREPGAGRPTKLERRQVDRLKGRQS